MTGVTPSSTSRPPQAAAIPCASSAAAGAAGASIFPIFPGLRPTPDRVRETLFNWLQHAIAGHPLPGFVRRLRRARARGPVAGREGSGVRRAGPRRRARLAGATGPLGRHSQGPSGGNGRRALSADAGARSRRPFDIVFLDPPFGRDALAEYVPLLDAGDWLKPGGLVYLENEKPAGVPALPATGSCSNRSRRARWGIIWRASMRAGRN